jgi:nucleoside-diphosphate-sugar epimerase
MKNFSILGAGWLGTPLALALKEKGHQLKVSTTTPDKVEFFQQHDIPCYVVELGSKSGENDLDAFLSGTDVLIVTIPPKITKISPYAYAERINFILWNLEKHQIKEVIFTSSVSVYHGLKGEVDESTTLDPVTPRSKQMAQADYLFLNANFLNATVLRLGGLIGEDRNPLLTLTKKSVIEAGNKPVNLVHQEDIIRFIAKILEEPIKNEIFNVVAPIGLSRNDFYTREAQTLGIKNLPEFIMSPDTENRTVNGSKIIKTFGLDYLHLV